MVLKAQFMWAFPIVAAARRAGSGPAGLNPHAGGALQDAQVSALRDRCLTRVKKRPRHPDLAPQPA